MGGAAKKPDAAQRLNALLTLAQVSRDRPLHDTLLAVAETVQAVLGYQDVVVNVYRPASHDYEVVLVLGDPEARAALMHSTNSYALIHDELLRPEFERVPGAYFLTAGDAVWDSLGTTYTPAAGTGSWHAEDGVIVTLHSTEGAPLGLLSMDQPASGRRPTTADLEMLVAVAAHAAMALDTAQRRRAAARHRAALMAVAGFPAQLDSHTSDGDVLARACAMATQAFGFGSATALLREADWFVPVTHVGGGVDRIGLATVLAALEREDGHEEAGSGCRLVRRHLFGSSKDAGGIGPRAWHDEWLLTPLRGQSGTLVGLLVLDEPDDGLHPDPERLQEVRLLADQAVSALDVVRHRAELDYQANHDALTGLRNRRELQSIISRLAHSATGAAVLLCDLDHFKTVNDRLGHTAGDRVLQRFGELLRAHAHDTDYAVRYGGEEFCLVLPSTDEAGARAAAVRLLAATPVYLGGLVERQTVSIGIATTTAVSRDAEILLRAADAAMYAAKQHGRDRCFAATTAGTCELVEVRADVYPAD